MFNRCIELGQYPESLKIAKVIPFFKNGNKDDPSNFRPISLLPIIGKVFERIIFDRIQNYLNVFEILSDSQFGVRHGKSTVDAIATLIEEIRSNLHNNSEKTKCTFLDLKKAFDTVDHKILLQKCYRYGLRGPIYNILKSYLYKRTQYTLIGDKKSKLNLIELGVPQGSILGPLLFIIYMNDLSLSQKKANVILYADDTVVKSRSSASKIDDDHDRALDNVNDWLIKNKLTLNKEKTKSMLFVKKNQKNVVSRTFIKNTKIEEKQSFKYLGITIDNDLRFTKHSKHAVTKLLSNCSIFCKLRNVLRESQMIKAFKTYIQPIVQYGVLIYGSTTITTIREIDKVIKRIVRLIFHRKKFESTYEERVKHRIYLASELHAYEVLKQTLKNIRRQCNISPISKGFSMQNCLKKSKRLIKNKITQGKNLFHSFSIIVRIRRVLRMLLGYDDEIIEKIENMSTAETKNFCHQFLDNYILGNEDIVRLLYEF